MEDARIKDSAKTRGWEFLQESTAKRPKGMTNGPKGCLGKKSETFLSRSTRDGSGRVFWVRTGGRCRVGLTSGPHGWPIHPFYAPTIGHFLPQHSTTIWHLRGLPMYVIAMMFSILDPRMNFADAN